jgi:hypothetical protein
MSMAMGEHVTASHEVLFGTVGPAVCDACGAHLPPPDLEGAGSQGRGAYLRARGDHVELEEAPLCASCAAAIGVTALARWEAEEDEG